MVKPCLVAFQTGHNLPQARRSAELAVQQGDQVPLRRQFTRQLVGPTLCKANERCNDQNGQAQKAIPHTLAERVRQRLQARRVPEGRQRRAREWALTLWSQKAVLSLGAW